MHPPDSSPTTHPSTARTTPHEGSGGSDTLVLDLPAARHLVDVMAGAAIELHRDQLALEPMLDEAAAMVGRDQRAAVPLIVSARGQLDDLAADLAARLSLIESTQAAIAAVDGLTATLAAWRRSLTDAERQVVLDRRSAHILDLVDGDASAADRVERAVGRGFTVGDALIAVEREMRSEAVIAAAADALVARFDLDLPTALARSEQTGLPLLDAIGQMLTARALGLTLEEFDALDGLRAHFAVFDNATGDRPDRRVSAGDLEFVVGHPWRFTPGQVLAAQALLDQPGLRNRLDTADENTDILEGDHFGHSEPGDGLIAERDLQAFLFKAQLNHLLAPFADEIDIANDPSGELDGYLSKNDFRAFVDSRPDLPEAVVTAVETMIANGWFDESWWQSHKDELAMGAALLAGGIVVIVTAGGASVVLVAGAGALAAAGTTIAVNLAGDDDLLDDVFENGFAGLFVGAGVHTAATGIGSYGVATTGVGRSAAVASVTAGAGDAISLGAIDLVIPEEHEEVVHDVAGNVGTAAGTINGSGILPPE